jgi:hypothetical protein
MMTLFIRNIWPSAIATLLVAFAGTFAPVALAQYGTGQPADLETQDDGPAPVRDLSGVWTRVRPEGGGFYSNATWSPEGPELTDFGQELYAQSRNSNAGDFALAETNDPVLTRCGNRQRLQIAKGDKIRLRNERLQADLGCQQKQREV